MGTKKKKSKRILTRKKHRGGVHGKVLNIKYNKDNEIVDVQIHDILAKSEYQDLNHINPKYGFIDLLKDAMNFREAIGSTHDFFHPFDKPHRRTTSRNIKLVVNDKRDIQLIKITNRIIRALNTYQNKTGKPFVFVRIKKRITPESEANFKHAYNVLLREVESGILDKVGGGENFRNVVKLMLRTPVLVNLVSIKFGLLRRGDMKIEEIRRIFGNTSELVDSLKTLKYEPSEKSVGLDELLKEEDEKRQNQIIDNLEKMKENKNCAETGTCKPEVALQPASNPPPAQPASNPPQTQPVNNPPPAQPVNNPPPPAQPVNNPPPTQPVNNPQTQPASNPPANASQSQASSIPTTKSDSEIEDIIKKDKRLTDLFTFDSVLSKSNPLATNVNTQTRDNFYKYMRGGVNNLDPKFELQKYIIENLLALIGISADDLIKTDKINTNSYTYQAIVLTLIRIFLTKDMKDYIKFKDTFIQVLPATPDNIDICESLTSAADSLSSLSIVTTLIRMHYSYDIIIDNFTDKQACKKFDEIITINFNKLYDMLVTKGFLYINEMKQKAIKKVKGNPEYTVTQQIIAKYTKDGYYDETYNAKNPNYIFT